MRRDLSHLLVTNGPGGRCSSTVCATDQGRLRSTPAAGPARETELETPDALYWNLFAYPIALGPARYAFLTDTKAVLAIDAATFQDLQAAKGGPVPNGVPRERLERFLELGLVRREPPRRQFEAVFAQKTRAPQEHKLLHVITSYTCNLTCSYCFMLANLDNHERKLLSFEDAQKGIDLYFRFPHLPDSVIHFYGGEPLLHPQLGGHEGRFSQPIAQYDETRTTGPFAPWKDVSKATSRKCSTCPISAICGGDCSFDRYNRTGSLLEPLPFHCDLRLRMADHLAKRLITGRPIGFATVA